MQATLLSPTERETIRRECHRLRRGFIHAFPSVVDIDMDTDGQWYIAARSVHREATAREDCRL